MSTPAVDGPEPVSYHFQVGEPIGHASFWKRRSEEPLSSIYAAEFPIYSNTRGKAVWNSEDPKVSNQTHHEPTDAFWDALRQIHNDAEWIDLEECEWYEREMIHSLMNLAADEDAQDLPLEIGELFHHALEEVAPDGDE